MCAILDINVAHQVFGSNRPPAGEAFFKWLDSGTGQLVAGGELLRELDGDHKFRTWRRQAILAGRVRLCNDDEVNEKTQTLKNEHSCRSDDRHILALAQVSGARLLYSNDEDLQRDFKDKNLIDNPRGKVYSTLKNGDIQNSHRRLLGNRHLCRSGQ